MSGYGWSPDLPDQRDHRYVLSRADVARIPAAADLTRIRGYFPAYDQGSLGSCTGNSIAAALQYDALLRKAPLAENPSRLFIYYLERVRENTVASDAGAQIRTGIKVVAKDGAPPESLWPYVDDHKAFRRAPNRAARQAARLDVALSYQRLRRDRALTELRAVLGVARRPFVFGFTVYESFESDAVGRSGVVPLPEAGERTCGGHAVLAVGYDDRRQAVKVRNSWGPDWGRAGHCWLPYAFFTRRGLSSDFWLVTATGPRP